MKITLDKAVKYWLYTGCAMIFLMVIVGGITRLTGSGLSMVDWRLVDGAVPPLNEADWQKTFEKYQHSPQFQELNSDYTLSDFKSIFWWEYIHRLLGRTIGLVFVLPLVYFLIKKKIPRQLIPKLVVMFALGGLQGYLGWYMVKSGLVNVPRVSHYRLALHLITALGTFGYIWWTLLRFDPKARPQTPIRWRFKVMADFLMALLTTQIIYGAFVAGMDAGSIHNTFPTMDGQWISNAAYAMRPLWTNLIENKSGVQFIHRWMGIGLLAIVVLLNWSVWKWKPDVKFTRSAQTLGILVAAQIIFGISTLVFHVPTTLALIHQAMAFFLLANVIHLVALTRY